MKIKTGVVLNRLDGSAYKLEKEDMTIGKMLAHILNNDTSIQGKMKAGILAMRLYGEKEVEVDGADIAIMKEAVSNVNTENVIAAQLLQYLEELK